ncbi:MAG TPA: hypothetical protein VHC86_12850 [Opitutaceae bacterium]|nr:hypothetical protein [Opitutaceae bacterium]
MALQLQIAEAAQLGKPIEDVLLARWEFASAPHRRGQCQRALEAAAGGPGLMNPLPAQFPAAAGQPAPKTSPIAAERPAECGGILAGGMH